MACKDDEERAIFTWLLIGFTSFLIITMPFIMLTFLRDNVTISITATKKLVIMATDIINIINPGTFITVRSAT